jgi:epoxyqueuosine reductase
VKEFGRADALARALKERARAAGFDEVGIARAERLDRDAEALASWLGRGLEAGMVWLARQSDKRSDPRKILPGCRSVVCLAVNYWPGPDKARTPPGRARVALYARSRDYHRVLRRKLEELARWLVEESGEPARAFVDTGPVLERAWAERAGIGWIGKNANLIHPRRGSFLLLGEILTAAELAPDPGPSPDFCGTCTACLEACPTGAILEPRVVDSGRCISYWTIEHRGPIPEDRREGIGEWIFGCDICQEVCPWNRTFARATDRDDLGARDDLRGLDPVEVLSMDENEFRQRFSGTPILRARFDGIRRNAAVVLGNRADPSSIPVLERSLSDEDPLVRSHAAWALEKIRAGTVRRGFDRNGRLESPEAPPSPRAG